MDNVTRFGGDFAASMIRSLSSQEEAYVRYCLQGINPTAAARSAGYKDPVSVVTEFADREDIQQAIAYGREMVRQAALSSGALEFTRDDATVMYLDAHSKAENATEMIRATDSLVKLHGLAEPEKKEIKVTSRDQIQTLDSDELLQMAGSDIQLTPDQYTEVKDE